MDVGLKKDRFGFAMGYVEDLIFTEKEYMDDMTQSLQTVKTRMPIVVVEFVLEVYPEQEFGEVELSRVRFLIFQLQKFGYRIRYSSADGYQSKDMEQILKRHGIQHDYISMDKTTEPYETYRSAVYDGRVKCVYHPKLEEEMNKLERNYVLNKVDHPARGSKDLCDAVGQLVYNCHTNLHFIDEAMVPSSLVDVEESPEEDLSVYLKKFDDWVKGITKKKET
jgi:hypothetical protein